MVWCVLSLAYFTLAALLLKYQDRGDEKLHRKKKVISRWGGRTTEYLSWGTADQSPSSSRCRSCKGCRSDSLVAPARPAQNTCSCRSPRSARTETQSELRTKDTRSMGVLCYLGVLLWDEEARHSSAPRCLEHKQHQCTAEESPYQTWVLTDKSHDSVVSVQHWWSWSTMMQRSKTWSQLKDIMK